jgi:hypothetical protein
VKDWNAWETQPSGHSHQVGERIGLHLLHYLAAVGLHCDLTDPEFPGNLFIQQARDYQRRNLTFATGKGRVTVPELLHVRLVPKSHTAAVESVADRL